MTKKEMCSKRIEKIREMMAREGMDALMLFSPVHMFYYSGYYPHRPIYPTDVFRLFPMIIPKTGEPFHIAAKNVLRFLKEESWIEKRLVYDEFLRNAEEFIAEVLRSEGLASAKIGIEEDVMVLFTVENLKRLLPGITLAHASRMLLEVRDIKDETEIALIQDAIDVTIIGYETAFREIKPGRTEQEVAAVCEYEMRKAGAEWFIEESQVLAGERSKLVRARSSDNVIKKGDLILMDMAAVVNSYGSDISRTVVVGKATPKQKEFAKMMLDVFDATLAYIKPGVMAWEVDSFVRAAFQKRGYGPECQAHLIGHGFGLDFHENPLLKPGSKTEIKPGMVFALEPAVSDPEFGTMRFEDNVLVTETGTRVLSSKLPRELIEL
ncbi:MAG: aminopeptidase P family protein [Deltaproteobacteria bacterium]|nr:aminopeptidase P family protein [Deltaproteobacteria bacterium]